MATRKTTTSAHSENHNSPDYTLKSDRLIANHLEEQRHSEELQDIITKVPSWILRWGIVLLFFILLILFSISAMIRYPDTIRTRISFQSAEKTYPVTSGVKGVIHEVMAQQESLVTKGQPLALIRTPKGENLMITAPAGGRAGSSLLLQPGTPVLPNDLIFIIRPINEKLYGIVQLPPDTHGVKPGQRVLINLNAFPEKEYGQLQGRIGYITREPGKDGYFTAMVNLDTSQLKRSIPIREWMSGEGHIITQDRSVLKRILSLVH